MRSTASAGAFDRKTCFVYITNKTCKRTNVILQNLGPRVRFNLWKLEFGVILVHCLNLLASRSSDYLDDFDQLPCLKVSTRI